MAVDIGVVEFETGSIHSLSKLLFFWDWLDSAMAFGGDPSQRVA
jgi:hypothetical protein